MPYFYEAELRNKRTVLVRGKKIIYTDAMTDCKKVFEFSIKELRLDKKAEEYAFMLAYDTKKSLIGVSVETPCSLTQNITPVMKMAHKQQTSCLAP